MTYIKTSDVEGRSWHLIRTWTRVPGRAITLCGKPAHGSTIDDFGAERSCESCLRAKARNEARVLAEVQA